MLLATTVCVPAWGSNRKRRSNRVYEVAIAELLAQDGRCIEQNTAKFLRKRLCLFGDLERDLDLHPRIEEEIGEGRWFVTVLIEPGPHIRQSPGQIVFVEETQFRRSHGFPIQSDLTRG